MSGIRDPLPDAAACQPLGGDERLIRFHRPPQGADGFELTRPRGAPTRHDAGTAADGDGASFHRYLKEWVFRRWYSYVNWVDRRAELLCLNYGYSNGEPPLALDDGEEANRYGIQLYRHVAAPVDIAGKDVVEIGCGRGGGLAHLTRTFRPASALGVDREPIAIRFCRRHYDVPGLSFRLGDAQQLDLDDASCDVVLNVESSHRYTRQAAALAAMRRILRPGGHLLLADFRCHEALRELRRDLAASGLTLCIEEDITANVAEALSLDDARRRALVARMVPRLAWKQALDFSGVVGSPTWRQLADHSLVYMRWVLLKE